MHLADSKQSWGEKQKFLRTYDYGMGGLWGYVLAPSAEAIRGYFPELKVVTEEPPWFTGEGRQLLERALALLQGGAHRTP